MSRKIFIFFSFKKKQDGQRQGTFPYSKHMKRGKMFTGKMLPEKWFPENWSPKIWSSENWSSQKWSPEKCPSKIVLHQKNARKFERLFYLHRLIPLHTQKDV